MKTMTCQQLGGACDEAFSAETFEQMAELSRSHAMTQMEDAAHLSAMDKMRTLMQNPDEMQRWMDERKAEFEALESHTE